jgi:peptidoglycan/xylan/chitin deacetylase (PgdA/CDA1 family)
MRPSSRKGLVPVLTYHSQNIAGNDYASNDRHALASDIQAISRAGMRVISLSDFVDWLIGDLPDYFARNSVVLTSDDAPIFDFEEVDYRDFGPQTPTRSILRHARAHITLFAIASPQAREEIGSDALGNGAFMTDRWWREADRSPWAAIENHGWDHCHPAVSNPLGGSGTFFGVSDYQSCDGQVNRAADRIAAVTGRRPDLFAYPYGESSDYLRNRYLPEHENEHGMRAAVNTVPEYACRDSSRWNIPRLICGRDWNSPDAFQAILDKAKRSW